jgi:hypothetical protein
VPANPGTALMALNEELTQVNMVLLITVQRISDYIRTIFKNSGLVFGLQPVPHSIDQFRNRHRIPMSFIVYQFVV